MKSTNKTAKLVEELQKDIIFLLIRILYVVYVTTHMSYRTAVSELLSSEEFETYRKSKTLKPNRKRKL